MDEAVAAANKKIRYEHGMWVTSEGEIYKSKTICLLRQIKTERERLRAL